MEALTGHYLMNGNGPLEVIKSPVAHKHSLARSLPGRLRQSQRCIPKYVVAPRHSLIAGGLLDHMGVSVARGGTGIGPSWSS